MRVLLPLLCISAAGCDDLFNLERLPMPSDAPPCVAVGHDEDADGADDGCDPCPFDSRNDGDGDGDGIALACDPDPTSVNEVLLFHGFGPGAQAQLTVLDGEITGDAFQVRGSGLGTLLWGQAVDNVWVTARLDVTAIATAEIYREVGVIFDARVTAASSQPDGIYCVLGEQFTLNGVREYVEVYERRREQDLGDKPISSSGSSIALPDMRGLVRASYSRAALPAASCTFETATNAPTVAGTPSPLPASGRLGLMAMAADVTFDFVFVASKP